MKSCDFDYEKHLTPDKIEATRVALLANFERYLKFMFYCVNEKRIMFQPFHKELCHKLENMAKQKNEKRNLCINVPVGAGKSLLVEYFISWCFARTINNAFVYTSYNSDLILKLSQETREICDHPVWQQLFKANLKMDNKSKAQWGFEGAKNRTGLNAKAMGGGITGLDAGNPNVEGFSGALIIDDPMDATDGMRYARTREECILYYDDKLATRRRTPKTPTILIMQRIHKEDLTGYLMANEPNDWDFLVIPAIKGEESFWPERYPVEELEKIKNVNPYKFQAQYQQAPITMGGSVIKPEWFEFYTEVPQRPDRIFITGDTAQKVKEHNDFSVFIVWATYQNKLYLLDMMRGKWEAPDLLTQAKALYKRYHIFNERFCNAFYIEDKASGTGLIQQLQREGGIPVVGVPRHTDKLTRVEDGVPFIAQGDVLLPYDAQYGSNPAILAECASFTRDDSHAHDDIVDTLMDGIKIGIAGNGTSILDVM